MHAWCVSPHWALLLGVSLVSFTVRHFTTLAFWTPLPWLENVWLLCVDFYLPERKHNPKCLNKPDCMSFVCLLCFVSPVAMQGPLNLKLINAQFVRVFGQSDCAGFETRAVWGSQGRTVCHSWSSRKAWPGWSLFLKSKLHRSRWLNENHVGIS